MARTSDARATVELWRTRVRPLDPGFLPPADRKRWETFIDPADRNRLASAVLLRDHILQTHGQPTRITRWCPVCRSDQHGGIRPPVGATWRLSVSHAADVVVIAYAGSAVVELGVDVEQVVRFRPELARFVLAPGEPGTGPAALAETWTAKEAVLKAAGCGLHVNPTSLEIRRSEREPGRVRVLTPHEFLRPIRDLPGIVLDVTAPLGLDPAAWRAALFVLGATEPEVRVRTFTDAETPAPPGPGGRCCSNPEDPASRTCC